MKKILIVDDMLSWREFHKNVLEEFFIEQGIEDYKIDMADYAREGLNKIYENSSVPYELIITDLQMEDEFLPKYAGEWLVEQIKGMSAYRNSKIIISSGCFNIKRIAEELNTDYIPKRIACSDINAYKDLINGR